MYPRHDIEHSAEWIATAQLKARFVACDHLPECDSKAITVYQEILAEMYLAV